MQERIEHSGAHFVSVAAEFLDHLQAEDRLFAGVIQNMKAYQAGIEFSMLMKYVISGIDHTLVSLTKDDIISYSQ